MDNKVNNIMYLSNYNLEKWGNLRPQSKLDACFDLRSAENKLIVVPPYRQAGVFSTKIRNGFCVDLNEEYELLIRPRSGLAIRYGITLTNCIGTIDAGYHKEVCTFLINFSDIPYTIVPGERVSQGALRRFGNSNNEFTVVTEINKTGKDGFGSSGRM